MSIELDNCPNCGTEWAVSGIGTEKKLDDLFSQVDRLFAENQGLRADNARLTARLNRMVSSAKIEDVQWRPEG